MTVSAPFIHRPVATTLLTLGLVLLGATALLQLPVAPLPRVDIPTIKVSASLPGASPEPSRRRSPCRSNVRSPASPALPR